MRCLLLLLFICTSAGLTLSAETASAEDCTPYLACESDVQISLPTNSCEVTLDPAWFGYAYSSCGATPTMTLSSYGPFGPGTHTVWVYAWIGGTYAYCWSNFTVEDRTFPTVSCEDQIVYTDDPTVINVTTDAFTVVDNCDVLYDLTVWDSDAGGYGTIDMQYTAIDGAGNSSSCISKYSSRPLVEPYCSADGNDYYEYINRVQLTGRTTLDNTSGRDGGYGYYVNHSASLAIGETNTISLSPGYNFSSYTEYWRVYIDINDDNVFSGSELVFQNSGSGTQVGTFNTPGTIYNIGSHRMRVIMSYGGYTNPCNTSFYGEVEDYMINTSFYVIWPGWGWREATTDELADLRAEAAYQAELALEAGIGSNGSLTQETLSLDNELDRTPTASAEEITIYPNPVPQGQQPNLELPANHGVSQLLISNSIGQRLGQQEVLYYGAHQLSVEMGNSINQAGMYLVTGMDKDGNRLWTKRLLMQ